MNQIFRIPWMNTQSDDNKFHKIQKLLSNLDPNEVTSIYKNSCFFKINRAIRISLREKNKAQSKF